MQPAVHTRFPTAIRDILQTRSAKTSIDIFRAVLDRYALGKTRAMVEWEYRPQLGRTAEQALGAFEDRLAWMRGARSDYEIALPLDELEAFAGGTGYYEGLPLAVAAGLAGAGAARTTPRPRSPGTWWRREPGRSGWCWPMDGCCASAA